MDSSEIRSLLQDYFDAGVEFDANKMSGVFHRDAHIYGHGEKGVLKDMDRDFFVNMVGSASPSNPPSPRYDEILAIDFTGVDTAVARVKVRIKDTLFTDILCFMRLEGKWGVISKVFAGVPTE